ncbi:glycoside hydrolase superfamily [Coprinopsis sp. MPI-PUGE-AT-0042]|nr:glycoside hydrolase superfamily [Coprinopsis sp. MPI-PUGE-AT-0042]
MAIKLLGIAALALITVNAQGEPWAQCGGSGWSGAATCVGGYNCAVVSEWYHQCQPGSSPPPVASTARQPPVTTAPSPTNGAPGPTGSASPTGLHGLYSAKHHRYFGNILDYNILNTPAITSILNNEFGVITAENSMTWDATEPNRGTFNFGSSDSVVNWATSRGKLMRGHTLVWHSQLPRWVSSISDRTTLSSVIQNHISQVAGRYRGKMYHWDVVNEVLDDKGDFRNSVFYSILGEEYIDLAFKTAREVDPSAKLYINDYNLDYAGPKLTNTVALIGRIKGRGTPIDGVGTQAYLAAGRLSNFFETLATLASTKLEVAITELNIRITKPVDSSKLAQQQRDYETVTLACAATPKQSFVGLIFPGDDSPLLWDDNYVKKPAYTGVVNAINA